MKKVSSPGLGHKKRCLKGITGGREERTMVELFHLSLPSEGKAMSVKHL